MGIFTGLLQRKSATVSTDSVLRELQEIFGVASAKSGVPVNWRTAMQATAAFACARVIANGLAQVPCKLYRELPGGVGREAVKGERLYQLLYRKPNDLQTAFEFWEQRAMHLVFCGNAFAFIVRVGDRIVELLPYEPGCVTVKRSGWDVSYEVITKDGRRVTVPKQDMWHTRGPSWDGFIGLDGVRLAREAIGLSLALEEHGAMLFANGAQPGGLLSSDQPTMTKEQRDLMKESWQESQAGSNKFKTAVMWGGMKWMSAAMPNDTAQFLETRRFQVEETCRAIGVLPIMIGHSDKATTYASAEQMFLAHLVHTMGPWYTRCAQSAECALLTEKQIEDGYYFRFVTSALMSGAAKDRAAYYTSLYSIGALNPNEIREMEERNHYEGGNEFRVPLNMAAPGSEPDKDPDDDAPGGRGNDNAAP